MKRFGDKKHDGRPGLETSTRAPRAERFARRPNSLPSSSGRATPQITRTAGQKPTATSSASYHTESSHRGQRNANRFLLVTGEPVPMTPIRQGGRMA